MKAFLDYFIFFKTSHSASVFAIIATAILAISFSLFDFTCSYSCENAEPIGWAFTVVMLMPLMYLLILLVAHVFWLTDQLRQNYLSGK